MTQPENEQPVTLNTSADPMQADLEVLIQRGKVALSDPKVTDLKSLAQRLIDEPVLTNTAFPDLAPKVEITAEDAAALVALPAVFGKVQPTERREITQDEANALMKEAQVLKTISDLLDGRDEAIKTIIRHHLDVQAEKEGVAGPDTPRTPSGNYAVPGVVDAPETGQRFTRILTKGTTSINSARLKELYDAGQVSREQYLAFTREERVFDEMKAREAIRKDNSLLGLLARITTRSGVNTQVRKGKIK